MHRNTGIKKLIAHKIALYPKILDFLKKIKNLSEQDIYKKNKIEIHHFIITAGLTSVASSVFKHHNASNLIKKIFGCRYNVVTKGSLKINIPIYCMDKTAKTRALFEICKGCFLPDADYTVDDLVTEADEWCPFENMIYIGDGDTDIPAFSLIKSRKGMTIGVFDSKLSKRTRNKLAKNMRKGKRIDLFTPTNFKENAELYQFIQMRCRQIAKRYEAHTTT